ncbi:ABC transporter ATP-binding protein [Desulfotignum balticum]|jgi:NitT/TauT family transport system ATP-binding protein|uniref:ABC transporter ATP-binding protein n=1 Tax=Desulfotignum balticum TaxID=115781 RepID=UPI00041743BB|nr:ATP-binding cassette domain-containing protein [Desulfotignum balticum]
MTRPVLIFDDVAMAYGDKSLFCHLYLEVLPGQIIGIQGPSGSGKSTLLKMAAGLLHPKAGSVTVNAEIIGYVFQEPRLLPWYTAQENICLVLEAKGFTKKKALETAAEFLFKMNLDPFRHHYPKELSGGMNQRVSIARALAVEPDLLLLDEPFTGLDPSLKMQVKEQIRSIVDATHAAVLHVTHATDELMEMDFHLQFR